MESTAPSSVALTPTPFFTLRETSQDSADLCCDCFAGILEEKHVIECRFHISYDLFSGSNISSIFRLTHIQSILQHVYI